MNRIAKAFAGGKAFIPFVTAGDPSADKTVEYILEMEKAGADLIELGIPFSDPTAEGPVIQAANLRALRGGMTTDGAFGIVEKVRQSSQIPLVFLTYLNPVFHYGYEAFFARCEAAGVDGIIIPDLPYEEKDEVARVAEPHGVHVISLVAPTSEQRIQAIAGAAGGFLYVGCAVRSRPIWPPSSRRSSRRPMYRRRWASASTPRSRPRPSPASRTGSL